MDTKLLELIHQQNPWLRNPKVPYIDSNKYILRRQTEFLLNPDWDSLWTILVGPRQSGKTTLGKHVCQKLIETKRFQQVFYLNCDYREIRLWLNSPIFLSEAQEHFKLNQYILFIDEVQRLESPGLLLKIIADLKLPIKMIASGSSQLEISRNPYHGK